MKVFLKKLLTKFFFCFIKSAKESGYLDTNNKRGFKYEKNEKEKQ